MKECPSEEQSVGSPPDQVEALEFAAHAVDLPLAEEIIPAPDPWNAARRLGGWPHLLFLDSALRHPSLGRYSFVSADPCIWLSSRGGCVWVSGEKAPYEPANPFVVLRELLARYAGQSIPGLPPFQGGAAGLFGYDLCHHIERLPRPRYDEFQVPELGIGIYDWVIAFDHVQNRAWIISTGVPETNPDRRFRRAGARLAEVRRRLQMPVVRASHALDGELLQNPVKPVSLHAVPGPKDLYSNFTRDAYLGAAARAIDYVHAGDCFQINLSQRLLSPLRTGSFELYDRLRECNPAPFAAYLNLGQFVLVSASPERFVCVRQGHIETRPIKGTRPRGSSVSEDAERIKELTESAKDRAENIMIVDLLRNDLGRVCAYGSVRVAAVCRVETYPFVHHLVSEVHGQLRRGLGPVHLLQAAFPGGSVTGAPKIRAMEIISELEPTSRGPYCGCLGYIGFDGTADTNILIRTCTLGRGWVQFPVGGGIVADSNPEQEYEETWHKAEGIVRALP